MKKGKLLLLFYVLWAAVILAAALYSAALMIGDKVSAKRTPGIKEKFKELEFVVVHRPHLTYFVDMKYGLCFATRKPKYQDLAAFSCPERLLKEATGGMLREGPDKQKYESGGKQWAGTRLVSM